MEEENDWVSALNEELERLISSQFEEAMKTEKPEVVYESIEDYTAKTGQRFRMTKTERESGMSREEAFQERFKKGE